MEFSRHFGCQGRCPATNTKCWRAKRQGAKRSSLCGYDQSADGHPAVNCACRRDLPTGRPQYGFLYRPAGWCSAGIRTIRLLFSTPRSSWGRHGPIRSTPGSESRSAGQRARHAAQSEFSTAKPERRSTIRWFATTRNQPLSEGRYRSMSSTE
jgi:hypothetical protein